jgi:hypothetical protein
MAGVAQEHHPSRAPSRQRIALDERPFVDFRAVCEHCQHVGMKPGISLAQHFKIAPRRPRLDRKIRLWRAGDEIDRTTEWTPSAPIEASACARFPSSKTRLTRADVCSKPTSFRLRWTISSGTTHSSVAGRGAGSSATEGMQSGRSEAVNKAGTLIAGLRADR